MCTDAQAHFITLNDIQPKMYMLHMTNRDNITL